MADFDSLNFGDVLPDYMPYAQYAKLGVPPYAAPGFNPCVPIKFDKGK